MYELKVNDVVVTRGGRVGIVDAVLGSPCLVVFPNFTMNVKRYNNELKHKNADYDIVKVCNGNTIEASQRDKFFRPNFDVSHLEVVWEGNA